MNKIKRYELKYSYPEVFIDSVYAQVLQHPKLFKEIYQERCIYNISLDSHSLDNYHDNISGVKKRIKHRIRWYNDPSNAINPILEFKYKDDRLGWKESYPLPSFVFDNTFVWTDFLNGVKKEYDHAANYATVIEDLNCERPVLYNYYTRKYFISADKRYRITVDKDLFYSRISNNYIYATSKRDERIIVEIKFDEDSFDDAHLITNVLENRIISNSKYVTGINAVHFYDKIPWEV